MNKKYKTKENMYWT